jgi:N-acetylglutamate synthase-like GNAT family acetyltransferase
MIRKCTNADFERLYEIINDAACAYRGVIPNDCWNSPYMTRDYLRHEIEDGVDFWGYEDNGELVGVMGIQDVKDVTLIRHAYVMTQKRRSGIGGELITFMSTKTDRPLLMGTWKAASWAVRFYQKHGFKLVSDHEHATLLRKYWKISDRQIETSVVLGNEKYFRGV